ncbi:DUF7507 domain-containing protein [Blautia ammoniilytica]|uniref:DUF7507 domain-containing protein n=1 Tax=Blautia ammoniilytica TaxID=2981782 RepID=A0ABT2TUJ7_9FIRM|nr:hypothetical protein [Blautia ammoniilytica]MCU6765906.1 hypothetical protein [Blautia ammoniilytica]SCI30246.1 conserved repeat domain [uncultured Blautia sp.]
MKKINMKKYTPKEFRKKKSVNKSYIRRMSRRIVNENVGIILAGTILGEILLSAAFVSASENEFNINERETIRIEQRAVWTDEENYKGIIEINFNGLSQWKEEIQKREVQTKVDTDIFLSQCSETGTEVTEEQPIEENGAEIQENDTVTEAAEKIAEENDEITEITEETEIIEGTENTGGIVGENVIGTGIEEENYVDTEETDRNEMSSQDRNENLQNENEELQRTLCFSTYLSEYFILDQTGGGLPYGIYTEEIPVITQIGIETTISKLYYTFTEADVEQDHVIISIPVTLREEYRYAETKTLFPVFQDSPLTVNLNGEQASGLYASVVEEVETNLFSGEESRKLLIQSKGPELLARAGKLDFSMELSQEKENPKAGEIVYYHVLLCNTGEREIENLVLQVQAKDYSVHWQQSQEHFIIDENSQAVLGKLAAGQTQELIFWLQSGESEEGVMEIKVQAYIQNEAEPVKKERVISTMIQPLKADFTVEKTADCILAGPGDTITYQICIRNTGERTLHSVLSTEKFLDSRIKARFLEMEGVQLNKSGTKALIPKILPGESVGLKAVVVLPEDIESSELINQVTVSSDETKEKQIRSEAAVTVQGITHTPVEGQEDNQPPYETAYITEHDSPKTGDPMFKEEYEHLMLLAFGISIAAGVHMLYKKRKRP